MQELTKRQVYPELVLWFSELYCNYIANVQSNIRFVDN